MRTRVYSVRIKLVCLFRNMPSPAVSTPRPKGRPANNDVKCGTFDVTMNMNTYKVIDDLRPILDETFKKWVCQHEQGEGGYEHWQIRGLLFSRMRLNQVITNFPALEGAHWSITSERASRTFSYVMKADTRVEGPFRNDDEKKPPLTRQLRQFLELDMYDWQKWIIESVKDVDNRCIKVVLDEIGNNGKSIIAEYLEYKGRSPFYL